MKWSITRHVSAAALAVVLTACGTSSQDARPGAGGGAAGGPSLVTLDGSSTVFPISEAVAEEFQKTDDTVRVTVGISGTGGGFQKFCRGEIDIANASRPISASEVAACAQSGTPYIELPIAFDGIAIAVNPRNTWADTITVAELKTLWDTAAQGKVTRWNQVRAGWPDREIHLFGAGVDSGTYDYFTEVINGKAKASRGDFTSSEDDNVIVQGIGSDELALGFLPFAYVEENSARLKIVPVDPGTGAVTPTPETIEQGTYRPLSRPVFIYVSAKAAARPEVRRFVEFYLTQADGLVREVNYVSLGAASYTKSLELFATERAQ